ncbi:MAG: glycoside hydrolase family 20 zincin-like fold domain-containing protein, partial [Muribaculaceae bacterium]|nr:glycoside hydrolase family 20 zincin-like fold domain-containing protein [Muribaculaceae bacterium]
MNRIITALVAIVTTLGLYAANPLPVIPYPQRVETGKGHYNAKNGFDIQVADPAFESEGGFLRDKLIAAGKKSALSPDGCIVLQRDNSVESPEGYTLCVTKDAVVIG